MLFVYLLIDMPSVYPFVCVRLYLYMSVIVLDEYETCNFAPALLHIMLHIYLSYLLGYIMYC